MELSHLALPPRKPTKELSWPRAPSCPIFGSASCSHKGHVISRLLLNGAPETGHFCPSWNFPNGRPLFWAPHQPGPGLLELHSSPRYFLHNPSPLAQGSDLYCGLKALPSHSNFLPSLFFTGLYYNKSLIYPIIYPILSWHPLGIRGHELTETLTVQIMARVHFSS